MLHSIRTGIAATLSLAVARLFGLPEAYWAAIATLVVMQSTLGATLLLSVERIAATALGAVIGALLASCFNANILLFAVTVFVLGLLCAAFRMEKTAYRYASVTLAIIVLIPRSGCTLPRPMLFLFRPSAHNTAPALGNATAASIEPQRRMC